MPEPAAPASDPSPATTRLHPSPNGTVPPKPSVPPMPPEGTQRPAAGVFRTMMSPLRKMMHRAPRRG
jgi:hypothetical protein